ncbi:MAG: tryptophan synthase subunit alpha [Phycisphaerales bacterium]|nr:tryptophan synthase subunit alpha [Phycisphaerales bacterium]
MTRIDQIFSQLRGSGRKGLMPFLCGGYPTLGATAATLGRLGPAGASIVEIGIPFSDPIADGPVIAAAMHEALVAGVTPGGVFEAVKGVRGTTGPGLVAMVSISIVHRMGAGRFVAEAKAAGFDGFIFPDVPLEEAVGLAGTVRDGGMTMSLLIAPTTPPGRAAAIARACSGFVYLLSRTGITGEGAGPMVERLARQIVALRRETDLPIACGFGISSASQVRAVVREAGADAAIVGSALVRAMGDSAAAGRDPVAAAEAMVRDLASGLA